MINVLSCFDGLSGGQIALEKAGIEVNKYYASEIDKYAIAVAKYHYPNTIHLGDVKKIDTSTLPKIDLMLAGSPCTDLSFAGLGKGLVEGEQSSLFFDWWRLAQELKPKYIFLENVRMKEEYKDQISNMLGFEPTAINSSLVSAQNRYRLYWFGIRDGDSYKAIPIHQPEDKGIILADILEQGLDDTWTPDSLYAVADGCIQIGETAEIKGYDIIKRVYSPEGKAPTLTTMQGGHREPKVATTNPKGGRIVSNCLRWRKLTPKECARLQTVPDDHCIMGSFDGVVKPISKSQQYKMLGNGWTIDVIAHILEGMK